MSEPILLWFRQDLRIADNPALRAAAAAGTVLPIYILDDHHAKDWAMGAASRWWLHHSLQALDKRLKGKLQVFTGDPMKIIPKLIADTGAGAIHWNRCYEPWRVQRDSKLKKQLLEDGIEVGTHNGSLIWEPWTNLKKDDTPYRVFTPFYRNGVSIGAGDNQLAAKAPRLKLHEC